MHDELVAIGYISMIKNANERGPKAERSSRDEEKRKRVPFGRDQWLYTRGGGQGTGRIRTKEP